MLRSVSSSSLLCHYPFQSLGSGSVGSTGWGWSSGLAAGQPALRSHNCPRPEGGEVPARTWAYWRTAQPGHSGLETGPLGLHGSASQQGDAQDLALKAGFV